MEHYPQQQRARNSSGEEPARRLHVQRNRLPRAGYLVRFDARVTRVGARVPALARQQRRRDGGVESCELQPIEPRAVGASAARPPAAPAVTTAQRCAAADRRAAAVQTSAAAMARAWNDKTEVRNDFSPGARPGLFLMSFYVVDGAPRIPARRRPRQNPGSAQGRHVAPSGNSTARLCNFSAIIIRRHNSRARRAAAAARAA